MPNQNVRMISGRLCDTEDWSNGCWNISFAITGINHMVKYIKLENCFKLGYYSHAITAFTVFFLKQINAAFVSLRGYFQKLTTNRIVLIFM